MIITRKALSRRTFLRGMGTTLALPLLDAMIPAATAWAQTPAKPVARLGFIFMPMGCDNPPVFSNITTITIAPGFQFLTRKARKCTTCFLVELRPIMTVSAC